MSHFHFATPMLLKYPLQSIYILLIDLFCVVSWEMQLLKSDTGRALELQSLLRLESYLFLSSPGLPHFERLIWNEVKIRKLGGMAPGRWQCPHVTF